MKRKKKEYLECAAFTVPSLFLVMLVFYIPFVMSLYYSLTEWNGISKSPKFIGLENFKKLFSGSSDFMQSLIFTGKYTIIFMIHFMYFFHDHIYNQVTIAEMMMEA